MNDRGPRLGGGLLAACLMISFGNSVVLADKPLPRSTPESQGVSSEAIRQFVEVADEQINTMHSFMLVRHGRVIAEGWWTPEAADKPHVLWSLSKSFLSTGIGMAVAEGKLSLDDSVLKFFPDYVPKDLSQNLAAMKVHDLLTMSCGHEVEPKMKESPNWAEAFLIHEVPHRPGTFFRYNSAGSHMLSIILGKATGEKLSEYLKPRLFEPLGIEEFQWEESPQGDTIGGWGLHLRTEDIAKFGQLYLQQGKWEGKQLLSPDWIAMATSKQVENDQAPSARGKSDWAQGYGFQFWRCRHGAYRGDGRDGQFCIVLPEQDAVVAITAKTGNMQDELNVVWDKLVPAFQSGTLPDNPKEQERLRLILAGLKAK